MAAIYLDTSALGRVLLGEPDAAAVLHALEGYEERIASRLLRVELRRLALRHGRVEDADQLLGGIALVPLEEPLLSAAESIHLATVIRLSDAGVLTTVMTYDIRLAAGARHHGLEVIVPASHV